MPRLIPQRCLYCDRPFRNGRNPGLYCSNAHRQAAYRRGDYTPFNAPAKPSRNKLPSLAEGPSRQRRPQRKPNKTPAGKAKK